MDNSVLFEREAQYALEGDLDPDFFEEINRSVSGASLPPPSIQETEYRMNDMNESHAEELQLRPFEETRNAADIHRNSNHMFHEMAIVKKRLGFDEQEFRERCHAASLQLSQEFKEIIGELYDTVDEFVGIISKLLHRQQNEAYIEYDLKLGSIRKEVVETEAMEHALNNFVATIRQAARQTFNDMNEASTNQEDKNCD